MLFSTCVRTPSSGRTSFSKNWGRVSGGTLVGGSHAGTQNRQRSVKRRERSRESARNILVLPNSGNRRHAVKYINDFSSSESPPNQVRRFKPHPCFAKSQTASGSRNTLQFSGASVGARVPNDCSMSGGLAGAGIRRCRDPAGAFRDFA